MHLMTRYTLYFGRSILKSSQDVFENRDTYPKYFVTHSDFEEFKTLFIDPRFDGYTLQEAVGVWKGEGEHAFVVTIVTDDYNHFSIDKIATEYKTMFRQDSVMYTAEPVKATFV